METKSSIAREQLPRQALRSANAVLVVRAVSDLDALRRMKGRDRPKHVELRLPALTPHQSIAFESCLNAGLRECGCSLGAKFMLLAFVGSIVWQELYSYWNLSHLVGFLCRTFVVVFLLSGLGKLLGIAIGKLEVSRIAKEIAAIAQIKMADTG